MKDNDFILLILIIVVVASIFLGHLGLSFHGIDKVNVETKNAPSLLSIISWAWNGLSFLFGLMLFQVEGSPPWLSLTFDIVIFFFLLWIVLKWIRGYNAGV